MGEQRPSRLRDSKRNDGCRGLSLTRLDTPSSSFPSDVTLFAHVILVGDATSLGTGACFRTAAFGAIGRTS